MADRDRLGRTICLGGAGLLLRETTIAENHADVADALGIDGLAEAERSVADVLFEASVLVSWVGVKVADGSLTLKRLKNMRPPKAKAKKSAEAE